MKNRFNFFSIILSSVLLIVGSCNNKEAKIENGSDSNLAGWKMETISPEQLAVWKLLGQGKVANVMGGQTSLMESEETSGVMLVSPSSYGKNVVLKYKILALTDASVFVNILSATNVDSDSLTIPDAYDGGMDFWTKSSRNYFFAFKNAPHAGTPFIKKNADPVKMETAPEQDQMVAGIYYDIEVGRKETKMWLSIDGKKVVEMDDSSDQLSGGHVAFRLRGLPGFAAACLIRDLRIYTN